MDGDVGGGEGNDGVQGMPEAVEIIGGQARDQVHVDGIEAGVHRLTVGLHHIGGGMGTAAGGENRIHHGLGIDAHAVHAAPGDDIQLFLVQGVGPSALHGELNAAGKVEGLPDAREKLLHLRRGQGGGRTASDIDGTHGLAGTCHQLGGVAQLLVQGFQVRLHQVGIFADGLADEGAVGAAGGAEGDAHIEGNVPGFQLRRRCHGRSGAVQAELCPAGGDEIGLFHFLNGFFVAHARHQAPGGQLGGPDTGQRAPGGDLFQEGQRGLKIALLQDPAAQGDRFLPFLHGDLSAVGYAAQTDGGAGGQPAPLPHQPGNGTIALKGFGHRFHGLQREQGELQLLHRVAFLVADQK